MNAADIVAYNLVSQQILARFVATNDCNILMELYNRHHDELIKWIRARYNVDRSIAQNVVIETFEHVRDNHHEFDGESFSDWLCTLAGNYVVAVAERIEGQRRITDSVLAVLDCELVAA